MSERVFKEVKPTPSLTYINPKTLHESGMKGTVVEGEYLGTVANQFEGEDFKFKLDDGSTAIINGCGSLRYKLSGVEAGTYVQINYNGKEVIESGKMKGKEAHSFTVNSAEEV